MPTQKELLDFFPRLIAMAADSYVANTPAIFPNGQSDMLIPKRVETAERNAFIAGALCLAQMIEGDITNAIREAVVSGALGTGDATERISQQMMATVAKATGKTPHEVL